MVHLARRPTLAPLRDHSQSTQLIGQRIHFFRWRLSLVSSTSQLSKDLRYGSCDHSHHGTTRIERSLNDTQRSERASHSQKPGSIK